MDVGDERGDGVTCQYKYRYDLGPESGTDEEVVGRIKSIAPDAYGLSYDSYGPCVFFWTTSKLAIALDPGSDYALVGQRVSE